MILVNNIKLDISRDSRQAFDRALKALKLPRGAVRDIWVHKVSIDARKGDVKFVYSVAVKLANPGDEAGFAGKNRDIQVKTQPVIKFAVGGEKMNTRPVVCGFGPAGFMAALCLAKAGFRPIVIEQGQSIDERMKSVEKFEKQGLLNTKSNIQFGEGGAGTFSDGKLTTRITDERCGFVTDTFIQNGAPAEIAKMAKPHIGTDLLVGVIKNIRKHIDNILNK